MPAGIRRKYKAEAKGRLRRARQGADKEGELSVWPSCRRREHRWQVDAPDTLPAEPLQKQQGNCRQALNLSTQVLEVLHSAIASEGRSGSTKYGLVSAIAILRQLC